MGKETMTDDQPAKNGSRLASQIQSNPDYIADRTYTLTESSGSASSTAIRSLRWFIVNGVFATCIYLGFVKEIKGAESVAIFWAWVLAVISIFLMKDSVIDELKKKKPPVPLWLDGIFDVVVVSVFVWFGTIATAIAHLIHFILTQVAWEKALKKSSKVPNNQQDDHQQQFGEITEEK